VPRIDVQSVRVLNPPAEADPARGGRVRCSARRKVGARMECSPSLPAAWLDAAGRSNSDAQIVPSDGTMGPSLNAEVFDREDSNKG